MRTGSIDHQEEASLAAKAELLSNTLTILVDTSLYMWKEVNLNESYRLNKVYNSYPRALRLMRNGKLYLTPLKKDTTVQVLVQPVFIANTSEEVRYLVGYSGHIRVSQEAKDRSGKWKEIEGPVVGGCAMVRYICELREDDYVLTTVFRFAGNFKTELRVKLETNNHTFYSNPFTGFINAEQLSNPKIKIIEGYPYERL